jgi:RNA polymerase sigma-70 factor (ECF subfamily)
MVRPDGEWTRDPARFTGRAMRPAAEMKDFRRDLVSLLPKLRRFAITLARNANDADDLVQEVCERAIARSHLWNGEGRLESWVYAMTRNLWVDEIRKRKVRSAGAVDVFERDEPHVEAMAEKAAYANQVQKMILSMPEGLASVFLLVNVEGHSYRETAEILGIPVGTVMSRVSTARLRLAAMLSENTERRA